MANNTNNDNKDNKSSNEHKGKQGFASMDEETKHRVQSEGGKTTHSDKK